MEARGEIAPAAAWMRRALAPTRRGLSGAPWPGTPGSGGRQGSPVLRGSASRGRSGRAGSPEEKLSRAGSERPLEGRGSYHLSTCTGASELAARKALTGGASVVPAGRASSRRGQPGCGCRGRFPQCRRRGRVTRNEAGQVERGAAPGRRSRCHPRKVVADWGATTILLSHLRWQLGPAWLGYRKAGPPGVGRSSHGTCRR